MDRSPFHFKKFSVEQSGPLHPVGIDGLLLGGLTPLMPLPERILDIGTGTGVVALLLAQRAAELEAQPHIDALEPAPYAAACAEHNFKNSPWANQLQLLPLRLQHWQPDQSYDLIVSNPPFFTETVLSPEAARRQARSTETLPHGELLAGVLRMLKKDGRFVVILPVREGKRLAELAVPLGLYTTYCLEIFSRTTKPVERFILIFEKSPYNYRKERLVIYEKDEYYTEKFNVIRNSL